MALRSHDDLDRLLSEALKVPGTRAADSSPQRWAGSSDAEFLQCLNRGLNETVKPKVQTKPKLVDIWFTGVWNGVAAAAVGLVIFVGLNVLPPFFVKASVAGADLVQEKIIDVSVQQHVIWQQILIDLKSQAQNLI